MKLMTKELEKRFARVGSQEHVRDPYVVTTFFNPCGAGTWYATEYDPKTKTFFGFVSILGDLNDEWGYFSLAELESYRGPLGTRIERDLYWMEMRFSDIPQDR